MAKLKSDGGASGLISIGAEAVGGAAGAAIGFMLGGMPGAVVGSAGSIVVSTSIRHAGNEIAARILSYREKIRVGGALTIAALRTEERLKAGDALRSDEYFDDGTPRPPAHEVTEGLLIAAQKAYEEKKVPFIGRLSANLNFRQDLDIYAAGHLTKLAGDLSYTQLCLLGLAVENKGARPLTGGQVVDKKVKGPTHMALLAECLSLSQAGLINFGQTPVWTMLDINPPAMQAQGYGVHLYHLMELDKISDDDLKPLRQVFSK